MSLGGVTAKIFTGGAQSVPSSDDRAKTIVGVGACTAGTPNVLQHASSAGGMRAALDAGPLVEAQALLFDVDGGPSPYAVPAEPSIAGALGSIAVTGTGSGGMTNGTGPHVLVDMKISTGGPLGTMKVQFRRGGVGAYDAPILSSSSAPWSIRVPGTFLVVTFPAGTYVLNSSATVGLDGTVTPSGTDSPGSNTSSAGPFDILSGQHFDVSIDEGASQIWTFAGTNATCKMAAAGAYAGNVPGTFTIRVVAASGNVDTVIAVPSGVSAGELALIAKINELLIAAGVPALVEDSGDSNKLRFVTTRLGSSTSVSITAVTGSGFTTETGIAITAVTATGTATLTKTGGTGTKSVTIAFLDAALASEIATAVGVADGLTGGTLVASGGKLVLTTSTNGASPKGVQVKSTSSNVLGFDTTEHNGITAGEISSVTALASPIDNYDFVATVQKGGALGVATLSISLDGGRSTYGPPLLTPAGGTVVIPGTGVVLFCSSTFTAGDAYSFPCAAATPSSTDVQNALNALLADPTAPPSCVIDIGVLPASAAAAFSLVQVVETFLDGAFAANKDWLAMVNVPTVNDIIVLTGTTELDAADTRSVIKAARVGVTANRVSVFEGTDNVQSAIGTYQVRRPRSTSFAPRIAGKLPVEADRSTVATRDAPLGVAQIGDDERFASVSLYDAQINSYQTDQGLNGAYLTIGKGLFAWQNLTTDANLIDADGFRAVNAILAGFRPTAAKLVARKYPINDDGTIEEKTARGLDSLLDSAIKKRSGFGIGGDFGGVPQVSDASASEIRSSNLGPTGDKVIGVHVSILPLGFASAVEIDLFFQGA